MLFYFVAIVPTNLLYLVILFTHQSYSIHFEYSTMRYSTCSHHSMRFTYIMRFSTLSEYLFTSLQVRSSKKNNSRIVTITRNNVWRCSLFHTFLIFCACLLIWRLGLSHMYIFNTQRSTIEMKCVLRIARSVMAPLYWHINHKAII